MTKHGWRLTVALLVMLCNLVVAGQDDHAKQKAIDQMRRVANAIKQCPEQKSSNQDECQVHYFHVGPPTNVEWDVLPSKTVRSPFQGIIEFSLPSRSEDQEIAAANQSKRVHQQCVERAARMAAAAQVLAETMKQGPKWREGHYRYEFDVGSDTPELVKLLWVVKDQANNTVTSAVESTGHECWVVAANSVGSTKTEASSPPPK